MKTSQSPQFLFFFLLSFFSLWGCSSKKDFSSTEAAEQDLAAPIASEKEKTSTPAHVIKQAEVKFEVKNLEASTKQVEAVVQQTGATLANTTQQTDSDIKTTDFIIRVRPEKFSEVLQELQKESIRLDTRTIITDDVSLEYVDLQARKIAKLAVEQRFMGLLKEAKTIPQILEVEKQILAVREEIESAEARLRYLQNQTAYSTIRLAMYQVVPFTAPEEPGFFTKLLEAMSTGWELIKSFIIGMFYIWPFWLIGAGIMVYLRRRSLA